MINEDRLQRLWEELDGAEGVVVHHESGLMFFRKADRAFIVDIRDHVGLVLDEHAMEPRPVEVRHEYPDMPNDETTKWIQGWIQHRNTLAQRNENK